MRDDDLLDLIDRAALEDLTPEECAAIRAAAESSPEIRRACLARIGLEEHLATTLGRPRVSVDDLLARRRRFVDSRFAGGWMAPLLIGLLVAAVVVAAAWIRHRGVEETPRSDGPVEVAAATGTATTDDTAPLPGDATASAPAADDSSTPPEATRGDVETTVVMEPEASRDETEPRGPWTAALADDAPEPTQADLFRWIEPRQIDPAALQAWFRSPPGKPAKFGDLNLPGGKVLTTMTGTFSLVPPLGEGTALRLLLVDPGDLRITAWAGNSGVVIEREGPAQGPRWAASVLTRPAADKPPATRWLASTSDARDQRSGAAFAAGRIGFFGVLELRHADGALVLSRGEVRLAEAPLPGPPDEVTLAGKMSLGGIELVKAVPLRPLPKPPPVTETWRPAEQEWGGPAATAIEKRADGSVRLAQQDATPKTPLIATWRIPPAKAGPRDIVLRITDHAPGTGVCISGTDGKPSIVCGFVEPTTGLPPGQRSSVFMAWRPDKSPTVCADPRNPGLACAPPSLWLRLTPVDANVILSWSQDGSRWARLRTFPETPQGVAEVGLFAGAHAGRAITLAEIGVAELPGFARVLPRDLAEAVAPTLPAAAAEKRIENWSRVTLAAKPAGIEDHRWLAAAAIRCLATQPTTLTTPLCQLVWSHVLSGDASPEERLDVCDDINRLSTGLDPHAATRLNGLYGTVARQWAERGDVAGFERAWLRLEEAPGDILAVLPHDLQVDPLSLRDRLLRRLFAGGRTAEIVAPLSRMRFLSNDTGLPAMLSRAAVAASPVIFEYSNALATAAAEFDVEISQQAWADAQRAVARWALSTGGDALHGLVEDPRDPDRLVTMPTIVADALVNNADFAAFMRGAPAARGRLRVAQLRAAGDADGMSAAAIEFQATPAAAEARAWLAERQLAAGDFLAARKHAQIGLDSAAPEQRESLLSIRSLAEALAGLAVAQPPRTAIGGLPAAEVAALVAGAVKEREAAVPATAMPVVEAFVAPPPSALGAVKRCELGPAKQGTPAMDWPGSIGSPFIPTPPFLLHRLDWSAEVCDLAPAGGRLLAANRQEIVAVDAATGAEQWRVRAGPDPCSVRTYSLVAFRPVCDAMHAFVRRIPAAKDAPALAAIRLADGTIAWQLPPVPAAPIVSDPVLLEGVLWACEVRSATPDELVLVAFDPRTGARRFGRVVGRLMPGWRTSRSDGAPTEVGDCQLALADGRLVVTAGGSVICCADDGHPLWVRRQPWAGSSGDPWKWWWFQAQSPALSRDGRLYVMQPGVAACTAIDLASGRLIWRTTLPLARRLVGIAGTGERARVVVETGDGIVSLHPRDGAATPLVDGRDGPGDPWLGIAPSRLMAAAVATTDGHAIVAVQSRRPPPDTSGVLDTTVLWIDAVSATVKRAETLPAIAGQPPWVGPMAATADKLWVLTAPQARDPRRTLWELAPKP